MTDNKDLYILLEEKTVYDLNWLYCRRKIINFNQFLNNIILSIRNKILSYFKR